MVKLIGIDVGFSDVKTKKDGAEPIKFASVVGGEVVGSGFRAQNGGITIEMDGKTYLVGGKAEAQSLYASGRRDPGWVLKNTWDVLLCAAISEAHGGSGDVQIVTGLPLQHFAAYAAKLQAAMKREYRFRRGGGKWQNISITHAAVITQPFGAVFDFALDGGGNILDNAWAAGPVGIGDIGGNTLNALVSENLMEVAQWTKGSELGLLKALEQVGTLINQAHPSISPRTREVRGWIQAGEFAVFGEAVDITPYLAPLYPVIDAVEGFLSETFKEPGRLSRLGLVGGAAVLLRDQLSERFKTGWPPVEFGDEFTTVKGMFKFGKRLKKNGVWK